MAGDVQPTEGQVVEVWSPDAQQVYRGIVTDILRHDSGPRKGQVAEIVIREASDEADTTNTARYVIRNNVVTGGFNYIRPDSGTDDAP